MKHQVSSDDRRFRSGFEAGAIAPEGFNHRAHVRLAYVYLAGNDAETALSLMRAALLRFLEHHRLDLSKYHETMTRAWILAVRHFMETSAATSSSGDFIENNPILLDTQIMLTHYSVELLYSNEARARFLEPNLEQIPRYDPQRTVDAIRNARES